METFPQLPAFWEGNQSMAGGFPRLRASNAELCCFLWCDPEQAVEQTVELLVILDVALMWRHSNDKEISN